jgi:predicted nuclease of predicted toxin-antitoxin system
VVASLVAAFPDSSHVALLGLDRATDAQVWHYAKQHGYHIVTKDDDFYHLALLHGPPPKVIWVRLGNCTTRQVLDLLISRREHIAAFVGDVEQAVQVLP